MTEAKNITEFKKMVGIILGHLYATHPTAQFFDREAFISEEDKSDHDDIFEDTAMYLVENGYINRVDKNTHLRLSVKAWEILDQPNPLDKTVSLGASLAKWSRSAASDIGKDVAGKTVEVALKSIAVALGFPAG